MLSECTYENKTPLCLLFEIYAGMEIEGDFLVEAAQRVLGNDKVRCEFEKILADPSQGPLIHLAIEHFGSQVVPFVSLVKESAMSVQDSDGNTPLHIAVDVRLWRDDNNQQRLQLIRELVKRCDRETLTKRRGNPGWKEEFLMSPYVYMMSQADSYWPIPDQTSPYEASLYQQSLEQKELFELVAFYLKDVYMSLEDHDVFEHLYSGQRSKLSQL